ncbi:MAG TPA: hypothetical protein VLA71_01610 [Algoriphagus sp.]|nr:hypothetical protein [Algoriphagus sp.]
MKAKLFPILLLLISLFGCNDENLSPEARIQGRYEYLYQSDQSWGEGLKDYSNTIELRRDGTFYREEVTRNIGSDEMLGYRGYGSGTYTISEGKVELHHEEIYVMGIADLNYVPKSDLMKMELSELPQSYTILNNYTELEYVCPINALCGYLPVYKKLN